MRRCVRQGLGARGDGGNGRVEGAMGVVGLSESSVVGLGSGTVLPFRCTLVVYHGQETGFFLGWLGVVVFSSEKVIGRHVCVMVMVMLCPG